MTTIIGIKVYEPKEAIVLATDLQASFDVPIPHRNGIAYAKRKDFTYKIEATSDHALFVAMTGIDTVEYRTFLRALRGERTQVPPFNLVDELRSGDSKTIRDLNQHAMYSTNGMLNETVDTGNRFNLAVIYRNEHTLDMWQLTETGLAVPKTSLVMGSGRNDADKALDFMVKVGDFPSEYKTKLSRATYAVLKALEYATRNDAGSSGRDLVIITKEKAERLTDRLFLHEENRQNEKEVIRSLDDI